MKSSLLLILITIVNVTDAYGAIGMKSARSGSQSVKASFDETYERYPAPYDLFYHLQRLFPRLESGYLPKECGYLNEENTTILGGILPNFGAPLEKEPGALFTELYVKCLDAAFDFGLKRPPHGLEHLNHLLGNELVESIPKSLFGNSHEVISLKWKSLSAQLQARIVSTLIEAVVGPDEFLVARNILGDDGVFGAEGATKRQLIALVIQKSLQRQPDPELWQVLRDVTILLRLGPTLLRQ